MTRTGREERKEQKEDPETIQESRRAEDDTEQPNLQPNMGLEEQARPEAYRNEEQRYDEAPKNPRPVESSTLTRIGHRAGEPPK